MNTGKRRQICNSCIFESIVKIHYTENKINWRERLNVFLTCVKPFWWSAYELHVHCRDSRRIFDLRVTLLRSNPFTKLLRVFICEKKRNFSDFPINQKQISTRTPALVGTNLQSVTREKYKQSLITPLEHLFVQKSESTKSRKKSGDQGETFSSLCLRCDGEKSFSGFYRLPYWLYSRENVKRDAKSGWMALFEVEKVF